MLRSTRLSVVSLAALAIACGSVTEVTDEDAGDVAGDGDADPAADATAPDAGPDVDVCARPPTPLCGEPLDPDCPPRQPSEVADVFPDLEPLGVLVPTPVLEASGAISPRIAVATSPAHGGGYGTALLVAARADGSVHRPARTDIPLDDMLGASAGDLPHGDGDLADVGEATSVAAVRFPHTESRIAIHIGDAQGNRRWRGDTDLISLETQFFEEEFPLFDGVGLTSFSYVARRLNDENVLVLHSHGLPLGGPSPQGEVSDGVPADSRVRMVTTTSNMVMLQDEAGTFWFWNSGNDPVGEDARGDSDGKAAWVEGSDEYLLAHHVSGSIQLSRYDCPSGGIDGEDTPCARAPATGPDTTVSTVAPSGEAPDGVRLADGRVALLITERYDDGDRLVLQVVEDNLIDVTLGRIELVDLRDSGERITDARIRRTETGTSHTLFVAAAVGPEIDEASRVVATGLRACHAESD